MVMISNRNDCNNNKNDEYKDDDDADDDDASPEGLLHVPLITAEQLSTAWAIIIVSLLETHFCVFYIWVRYP